MPPLGVLRSGPRAHPYIVAGVIEKRRRAKNYTRWIRSRSDIIANVSNIVYKGIIRRHESDRKVSARSR